LFLNFTKRKAHRFSASATLLHLQAMNVPQPNKKNRLTLYIFIALIAGIALGLVLNISYVKEENRIIAATEASLKTLKDQLALQQDTTAATYKTMQQELTALSRENKEATLLRDKKLEPFSIIADIFLRLIKMIVAPLVFTTLVV